jgi:hypothetical protein
MSHATGRGVVIALTVAVVLALLSRFVMAAVFTSAAGFVPFDLQSPLNRYAIAIQLGTIEKGSAVMFYAPFAVVDVLSAFTAAWFYAVFWAWLFAKVPNRVFAFFASGGILLTPFVAVGFDLAAKAGFARLIAGLTGPSYAAAIAFSADANRLKFAFIDLRNYLTLAFLLIALTALIWTRVSRKLAH